MKRFDTSTQPPGTNATMGKDNASPLDHDSQSTPIPKGQSIPDQDNALSNTRPNTSSPEPERDGYKRILAEMAPDRLLQFARGNQPTGNPAGFTVENQRAKDSAGSPDGLDEAYERFGKQLPILLNELKEVPAV